MPIDQFAGPALRVLTYLLTYSYSASALQYGRRGVRARLRAVGQAPRAGLVLEEVDAWQLERVTRRLVTRRISPQNFDETVERTSSAGSWSGSSWCLERGRVQTTGGMAFAAHAMSVVDSVLLKGGLGDPWSATAAQVAEDRKASKPPRPSSAANAKPARAASEAVLTRAPVRPSSAPPRKAPSALRQDKCTERLMVVQIHKLPPTHYDHQRHHMRAEELRHNVRPPSATQTQPGPIVGVSLLWAASLRRNAACQPRPACASMVTPSASRFQPRSLAGRKHAAKRLDAELKNLKRVFTLFDVGRDGVVTSEDIFVITGEVGARGSGWGER